MTDHTTMARAAHQSAPIATRQRATTIIPLPGGAVGLRYHDTYVVTLYGDGSYTLQHGGYTSATTRRRMNGYTPEGVHVYQRAHQWYVDTPKGTFPYGEGMRLSADGRLIDEGDREQGTHDREALAARYDAARAAGGR